MRRRAVVIGRLWRATIVVLVLARAVIAAEGYTGHYGSSAEFVEAQVNGNVISDGAQPVTVAPGQPLAGYLKVRIDRRGPATSVFPVAGTFSWDRSEQATVSRHLPPGVATVQYDFNTTAPSVPGKYFIAVIAGPYMSASELLTRDYDIWSTNEAGWMNAVNHSYIVAFKGNEQHIAKAILIRVAAPAAPAPAPAKPSTDEYTGHYGSTAEFLEAQINGQIVSDGTQAVAVEAGQPLAGYLKVRIDRGGPEKVIFPVAGTFSWDRQQVKNVSNYLLPGTSTLTYDFSTTAPSEPGTYFIAMVAGPYMSALDVLSRDYDMWSTDEQGWMNAVDHSYIIAFKGKEQLVAKAIRIRVGAPGASAPVPPEPAVEYTGHYGSSARFLEAKVNDTIISDGPQTVTVAAGRPLTGYLRVQIDRRGPATSVFPVAGTFSWDRREVATVSPHLPPGMAIVQYDFNTTAPSVPGTYFIAVVAGPYLSASDLLTRDYDIWATDEAGWMNAVNHSYIVAFKGSEQHIAKALCIRVEKSDSAAPPAPSHQEPSASPAGEAPAPAGSPETALAKMFDTDAGLAVPLPQDWERMSAERLTLTNALAVALNSKAPRFQAGFVLAGNPDLPYILVMADESRRIPEYELTPLATGSGPDASDAQALKREVMKETRGLLADWTPNRQYYDPGKRIVWRNFVVTLQGGISANGVAAMRLTEKGGVWLFCYAGQSEWGRWQPVFEAIANTAVLDASLAYKPRPSDATPPGRYRRALSTALTGGLVGGIAGAVMWLIVKVFKGLGAKYTGLIVFLLGLCVAALSHYIAFLAAYGWIVPVAAIGLCFLGIVLFAVGVLAGE